MNLPVARPLGLAIAVCVLGTLVIGIYPAPWVRMGAKAAAALQPLSESRIAQMTRMARIR